MIKYFKKFLKENNHIKSDAIGYNIGEYIYHITQIENLNSIKQNGFTPKDGISINKEKFENRLYFATSLIAAYDLSVNFGSYRYDGDYIIFKLKSDCINDYEDDGLFKHGIYVDYNISYNCVVEVINASELFNIFDDDDIEKLY